MHNVKYVFYPILFFLMLLYKLLIFINEILYVKKIIKTKKFNIPIISIGNIEAGGTGKTPFVIYLARMFQNYNLNPMIISRGYKRSCRDTIIVHDGVEIKNSITKTGDEPYLMALMLGNVPVVVGNNKSDAIKKGLNTFKIDLVILDDGFQSRKIERDLDIVLINGSRSEQLFQLIPMGLLREPINSLYRADVVILSKLYKKNNKILEKLPQNKIKGELNFRSSIVKYTQENKFDNILSIESPCIAFCGIGDNASFKYEIKNLGVTPKIFIHFDNHNKYDDGCIKRLQHAAHKYKTKVFITTAKDYVKLNENFIKENMVYIALYEIEKNENLNNLILKKYKYN